MLASTVVAVIRPFSLAIETGPCRPAKDGPHSHEVTT
jgi:hypothetical protein